jgi:two-component system, NarL family, sensor histidine kinase UhpB
MRIGLRPVPVSILWRVFTANVLVFGLAVFILIVSPATISNPTKFTEIVVIVLGLLVTLVVDLVMLAFVLSPLRALARVMGNIDPMRPGQRAYVGGWVSSETNVLMGAFNTMLDRVETERRESARRALAAQEAERLRIARELHDEIGQTLTAVALQAERAAEDASAQPQALRDIGAIVQHSLQDVRRIARELRPEALDDLGLTDALISLCLRIERQGALRITREIAGNLPPLSTEVELVVYRVAQEALTNALRHSGASHVRVKLVRRSSGQHGSAGDGRDGGKVGAGEDGGDIGDRGDVGAELVLTVSDDGRGLPASLNGSHGLEGMRERAILVHADLRIDSTPGAGVTVSLNVPIQTESR